MKHAMKYILITLMLFTFCSEAANVKANSKKQTIVVDKKPMTYKQKKKVATVYLNKPKVKCYKAYDSKTKKYIVVCKEGGLYGEY